MIGISKLGNSLISDIVDSQSKIIVMQILPARNVEFFTIKDNPAVDGPKNMIVLMQKDKRQMATGGWLFAGFGADGKSSGLDPATTCFGCHKQEAAQRDFVISTRKDFKSL